MENVVSLIAGILFKVVDEIEDTDIKIAKDYEIYIKTLFIVFITLFFYNNIINTLLFILFAIPTCFYVKQIDTLFWKSLIPIPFIILMLNGGYLKKYNFSDIFLFVLIGLTYIYCIVKESKMFPEEMSERKIIGRIYISFYFILSLLIIMYINSPLLNHIIPDILFNIGYFSTSIISKSLVLQDAEIISPLYPSSIHPKGELGSRILLLQEQVDVLLLQNKR